MTVKMTTERRKERMNRVLELTQELDQLTSPGCVIRLPEDASYRCEKLGQQKPEIIDLQHVQHRLEACWQKLGLPTDQRIDHITSYCLTTDKSLEYLELSQLTRSMLVLWEDITDFVLQRERLLRTFAQLELRATRVVEFHHTGNSKRRVKEGKNRAILNRMFKYLDTNIRRLSLSIQRTFNLPVTYQGVEYLKKMEHDRSDILYLIRRQNMKKN